MDRNRIRATNFAYLTWHCIYLTNFSNILGKQSTEYINKLLLASIHERNPGANWAAPNTDHAHECTNHQPSPVEQVACASLIQKDAALCVSS